MPTEVFLPSAAVRTQALIGTLCRRSPPRTVVEERETLFTVDSKGVVLAVADQLPKVVLHTLTGVAVTFASG